MLYSVLIYDSEAVTMSRSKEEDDALVARHIKVQEKLAAEGKLGPVARLMPTTAAVTVRQGRDVMVLDGPYAETKEQLGGILILEAKDLDHAIQLISRHPGVRGGPFEIRPAADLTDMIRESERRRSRIKSVYRSKQEG